LQPKKGTKKPWLVCQGEKIRLIRQQESDHSPRQTSKLKNRKKLLFNTVIIKLPFGYASIIGLIYAFSSPFNQFPLQNLQVETIMSIGGLSSSLV
jgi:hypothetical protein